MRLAAPQAVAIALALLAPTILYAGTGQCTVAQEAAGYCVLGEVLWAFDAPTGVITEFESIVQAGELGDLGDLVGAIDEGWLQTLGLIAVDNKVVCTAADVTLGICRDAVDQSVITIAITSANLGNLAEWIRPDRWDTVRCESGDVITIPGVSIPAGITPPFWAAATTNDLITDGDCLAGQIGQQVANPRSVRFWAWKYTRNQIRLAVLLKRLKTALDAAPASVDTDVDIGD